MRFCAILAILVFLFTGCGKQRVQVKPPALKPTPSPSKKAEIPAPKEIRPNPAQTDQDKLPEIVRAPDAPVSESTAAIANFSEPQIRIGLKTDAKEIRISSQADYYVTEKIAEAPRQLVQGEIQVRIEEEVSEDQSVYRIQVASYSRMDLAVELQERLAKEFTEPVTVRQNAASGTNQVRVGEFSSKQDAQQFQKAILRLGYKDSFIIKEAMTFAGGGTALAVRGSNNFFRLSKAGFLIQPSSSTVFLSINGKQYRGLIDVVLSKNGRITAVNQLGMEDYLMGVVPAEISPSAYPEPAALAAQAVAARTYALFHMGQYRADGFDITNDTRTQVYEGVGAEKSATNEAVRQTAGIAVYYQDKLIDAMFMSTCGGRTEDFANVYDAAPVPYLKSVFCAIENGPEKGETVIFGSHTLNKSVLSEDGNLLNRNIELAHVLGLSASDLSAELLDAPAEKNEAIRWLQTASKLAQKPAARDVSDAKPDLRTRAAFLQSAAETFIGTAEIKRRVSPRDADYYLGNLKDGDAVPEAARPALSYLIQSGLWRPQADNTIRPGDPITKGDALSLLLRLIESSRPDILRKGSFVSSGTARDESGAVASINVKWGSKTQDFKFSEDPFLFRMDAGRTTPVSSLRVIGNEKIAFHLNAQGAIDFLEVELNPSGASSDRYSPVANWDTTLARSAIAEKLRGMTGNIGEFRDLKPSKTGESGRAVHIQVIGTRGSVDLNGYKVRNALGLRDTLFSIQRDYNPDGTIAGFTFHGRGYGHGVGLCQVGAFGMARAGRNYEEIIKTYFSGVQLKKAY